MPDDHSEVVPLLPIPNRTVKHLCADDSAGSRVKVGHRQALTQPPKPPRASWRLGVWALWGLNSVLNEITLGMTRGVHFIATRRRNACMNSNRKRAITFDFGALLRQLLPPINRKRAAIPPLN